MRKLRRPEERTANESIDPMMDAAPYDPIRCMCASSQNRGAIASRLERRCTPPVEAISVPTQIAGPSSSANDWWPWESANIAMPSDNTVSRRLCTPFDA